MLKHLIYRTRKRLTFPVFVRFIGFVVGFTSLIVVTEWVEKELAYDSFWKFRDRIYRVALEQYQNEDLQFRIASNYRGVTDMLVREFPEVEGRVRLHRDRVTVFTTDIQIQDVNMFYADTCIFDILDRKIIATASSSLFPDLQSVMISNSLAHRLYGNESPVGKTLSLNEGWRFFVNGVFEDIPENSHIGFDLLMTIPSLNYYISHFNNTTGKLRENAPFEYNEPGPYDSRSWGPYYGYSYILVRQGTRIEDLKQKAESMITPARIPSLPPDTRIRLIFQPISKIHLHSALDEEFRANGSMFRVHAMILVALVILIISLGNSVNLSAIEFYDKSPASALRILHGAGHGHLLAAMFLKEMVILLPAGALSFILASLVLGFLSLETLPGAFSVFMIAGLAVLTALLTLVFPLYQIKTRSVFDLLKKRMIRNARGKNMRLIMVFIQFSISMFLIAVTIVIFLQMRFILTKDPGFSPDSVIFSYSPMTMNQRPDFNEKLQVFRNKLKDIPGVLSFGTSSSIPGRDFLLHTENVTGGNTEPGKRTFYQILNVDYGYIETMGLTLAAGRNFIKDDHFPGNEVILNQLAVRKIGFSDPSDAIGRPLRIDGRDYMICGVVRDFSHLSFRQPLSPVILFKSISWPYAVGYYSFRISPDDFLNTISMITKAWTDTYPREKFLFRDMKTSYREQYSSETNFSRSVTLGAALAILISCLGLLGFARYNAVKGVRETGIRKAFGASRAELIRHFNAGIVKAIAGSALLSLPLAWVLADKWLINFASRINVSVWMFLAAFAITTLIALATTFRISWKSSGIPPSEALRSDME